MTIYPSGIAFPFSFSPAGGVQKADDVDKVMSNLSALILSEVRSRLIRKSVGTVGYSKVMSPANPETFGPVALLFRQAISKYEPRATRVTVDMHTDSFDGNSKVIVEIGFIFKNTGEAVKLDLELT